MAALCAFVIGELGSLQEMFGGGWLWAGVTTPGPGGLFGNTAFIQ